MQDHPLQGEHYIGDNWVHVQAVSWDGWINMQETNIKSAQVIHSLSLSCTSHVLPPTLLYSAWGISVLPGWLSFPSGPSSTPLPASAGKVPALYWSPWQEKKTNKKLLNHSDLATHLDNNCLRTYLYIGSDHLNVFLKGGDVFFVL